VSAEDTVWMARALDLAREAGRAGEVPVGAVVVRAGVVLGEGWNRPISSHDPSGHAEIVALRSAAAHCANYRLPGATLYVTIEPCAMCAGALVHARIERLVFGARETRAGCVISNQQLLDAAFLNHRVRWEEGVLGAEAARLLQDFFRARRAADSGARD
jgi:tRNA(adenine34) deaminase